MEAICEELTELRPEAAVDEFIGCTLKIKMWIMSEKKEKNPVIGGEPGC